MARPCVAGGSAYVRTTVKMMTVGAANACYGGETKRVAVACELVAVKHSHCRNAPATVAIPAICSIIHKPIVHTPLEYFGSLPSVSSNEALPG